MTSAYAVVIPAFNEEAFLPATLDALERAMAAVDLPGEVIVVDNNSTDATAEVARAHDARVVFEPVNQISRARNTGARSSDAPHLVFLDADTQLPPKVLRAALDALAAGACGGGALVTFDRPMPALARGMLGVWNGVAKRVGLAAGCFVYCTREGFESAGGFSEKVFAGEEVFFSRALVRWGRKRGRPFTVIREPRVISSARKLEHHSTPKVAAILFILAVCPLLIRFRFFCGPWYKADSGR